MADSTGLQTAKRYLLFLAGLFLSAVGVGFATRAGLGTSPISSLPFVLSLVTAPSMGLYTFVFNMLFWTGDLLLRRPFRLRQLLAIPATLLFSVCIDWSLAVIPTQFYGPYLPKVVFLLIGCAVHAVGIVLELRGNVVMLPCEAFVQSLSLRTGKQFGNVKIATDCALTLAAAVIALFSFHKLNGVREGTLVTALLLGYLVKLMTRALDRRASSAPASSVLPAEETT